VNDIAEIASAAESAGADGVSLINTIPEWLSMWKRAAYDRQCYRRTFGACDTACCCQNGVPGRTKSVNSGHWRGRDFFCKGDALEFIIAGASLVQIGSGMFVKPKLPLEVITGIQEYLIRHNHHSLDEIIGSLQIPEGVILEEMWSCSDSVVVILGCSPSPRYTVIRQTVLLPLHS